MLIGFVFISCISHPMLCFITVKMKNQVPGTPSFSLFGTEWVELLEKKPGTGRVGYCDPVRAWSWGEVAWFSNLIWLKQSMPGTVVPLAMFSYSLMEKSTFSTASITGNTTTATTRTQLRNSRHHRTRITNHDHTKIKHILTYSGIRCMTTSAVCIASLVVIGGNRVGAL